jgi:hypothetical protein
MQYSLIYCFKIRGFESAATFSKMTICMMTLTIPGQIEKERLIQQVYRNVECVMQSVGMLSVIILSLVFLSAFILSVVMFSVIKLSVVRLSAVILRIVMLSVIMLKYHNAVSSYLLS